MLASLWQFTNLSVSFAINHLFHECFFQAPSSAGTTETSGYVNQLGCVDLCLLCHFSEDNEVLPTTSLWDLALRCCQCHLVPLFLLLPLCREIIRTDGKQEPSVIWFLFPAPSLLTSSLQPLPQLINSQRNRGVGGEKIPPFIGGSIYKY